LDEATYVTAVWGLLGAFIYAANSLILGLWADGATQSRRAKALAEFFAALLTGAIFAGGLSVGFETAISRGLVVNGIKLHGDVNRVTIALTVGWASNYLWPKLLRRLGRKVDSQVSLKVEAETNG
jgi:hypothetical protein